MRVLWINDFPAGKGGCESYVHRTAGLLRDRGVESFLLYDPRHEADPSFLEPFEGSFPMVDVPSQVRDLEPDLIYVHRCEDHERLSALKDTGTPVLRFFHDHRLFCLREHKYTPFSHSTCTRKTGLGCYACPGFVVRRGDGRVGLRTLGTLVNDQRANQELEGWIVGSRYMAGHLEEHGFDPARIHTVPLYVSEPAAPAGAAEAIPASETPELPTSREPGTLLFVGQLIRGKGLDLLLRALASLESTPRLVVAGEGAQGDEYRDLAGSLGLEGRVHFSGRLTSDELADLYERCTGVVVPSRAPETFGLVGLEALSHGAPVVASRVGGMGEWCREGVTGLGFDSGDVDGLATALDALLSDPVRAAEMGRNGRELHRREFLPRHHLDRLLQVFSALAGRPTPITEEVAA
jgi:glycosyltransferase involved in cell wall biosynthesis